MIRMRHVYKVYPSQICVLSDVSLDILRGEFVYLFGPTGCGKSTLLKILFCEERPSEGQVFVNGIETTGRRFRKIYHVRQNMGAVFQDYRLLRDRKVGENIAFALESRGYRPREIARRVQEVLQWMGLSERKDDPVLALSAGEQQRLAIARALALDPPVLLADEVTANLDARTAQGIMNLLTEFHKKGTTILFATHDSGLIKQHPFRVISLEPIKPITNPHENVPLEER